MKLRRTVLSGQNKHRRRTCELGDCQPPRRCRTARRSRTTEQEDGYTTALHKARHRGRHPFLYRDNGPGNTWLHCTNASASNAGDHRSGRQVHLQVMWMDGRQMVGLPQWAAKAQKALRPVEWHSAASCVRHSFRRRSAGALDSRKHRGCPER